MDNLRIHCFAHICIKVQAGAGGTESMDWAAMVMNMYKMWAQHRRYGVNVVDEMPGEIAGIKVHLLTIVSHVTKFLVVFFPPKEAYSSIMFQSAKCI